MSTSDPWRPSDELESLPVLEPRPEGDCKVTESWEHEAKSNKGRHVGWRWLFFAIPLVVAILAWVTVSKWMHSSASIDSELPDSFPSTTASSLPLPLQNEAESLIKSYMQADTVEKLLMTVHQPERVRPLMESYSLAPRVFGRLELLARRSQGSLVYHVAQALTDEGEKESFILLHTLRDGWRIDWETQVAYNPQSWNSLIENPPKDAVTLRVRAAPGAYYNYQYSNARNFLCVELREPNGDRIVYGYIDKDTLRSKPLMELLDQGNEIPLMVEVRFPTEGEADAQATIVAFLQEGWLRL